MALPIIEITNIHAAWGLLAWVGLLTIGVAYQVLPMFQVTPLYPHLLTRWLAWTVAIALLAWSAAILLARTLPAWLALLASLLLCLAFLAFGMASLYLLKQRKRPPDTTTRFWRTGLASLLACALLWLAGQWLPGVAIAPWFPLTVGILFIVGFAGSVVNGMLYKIVPFLVWYHLQHRMSAQGRKAPNVRQIITEQAAGRQYLAHLCALVLMAAAPVWPPMLARLAALALGISACWLGFNLMRATQIYRTALSGLKPEPLPIPNQS